MDAINLDILKQLQEYAQMYFNAIVEANTTCGKCKFADGQYMAKDVMKWIYALPCDDIFNKDIILESGTFKCKFPYRLIFEVLSDWESMSRAGKLKTVFEIGETETKSAKVLIQEKTALGAFKFKSMKLQRIAGNWWRPTKLPKCGKVWLYHETNGVMHIGGRQVFASELEDCPERIEAFCEKWNDEEFIKLMSKYNTGEDSEFNGYYTKVLELAGISNEPEQPATATETAKTENEPQEETNESVKHISEIIETCRTWNNEKRDYTDEYKYYTWLANHIPEHENTNKNVTEIVLEEVRERIATAATLVAHGVPKCDMEGAVCAVVNRLAKMEDILRFYDAIEPPQSPTTSTDIQTIKPQEKRVQAAQKEPKRTIKIFLQVQRPSYHFREVTKMVVPRLVKNVPRGCFTEWSPPIRGDCVIV